MRASSRLFASWKRPAAIRSTRLPGSPGEFEKLEAEHEKTGAALSEFKELTDSYTPPEWACNTFRALYDGLAHLEKDMHQHVHEENNVLFPKARAMARPQAVAPAVVPA